ncbi:SubName: Full=Uncharacterized protein {ECO:0000313/EMBL:CCA75418.1} [Serendipita indica DSM 11827]|nr:SubName: Full=Uncharacterized protein {ECO:0000313/EMBL:CCA75418.1} [Serendipita indica DSM 11827]
MGTSSLWARIELIFPEDLMDMFLPTKEYIDACLERSRGRLLDVIVKFPRYTTTTDYALDQILTKMTPVLGPDGAVDLQSALYEVDWECDSSVVRDRITQMENLVKILVGSTGENMLRWGSLHVTLSEERWGGILLWKMEDNPAPNLHSLEIMNMHFLADWFHEEDASIAEMPQLRSLKTDRLCLHWFVSLPTTLTLLDTTYEDGLIFDHLCSLQQLQHLCIRDATASSSYKEDPITLSHLSELHIYGNVDRILAILVTPRLEVLYIWSSQARMTQRLPSVPVIEWNFEGIKVEETLGLSQRIALTSIFENISKTRRLCLQGFRVELIDEIGNRLKRERGFSESLKVVEARTGNARATICEWDEMGSMTL